MNAKSTKGLFAGTAAALMGYAALGAGAVSAQAQDTVLAEADLIDQVNSYTLEGEGGKKKQEQLTSVFQLRDIPTSPGEPGFWAFDAIQSLVERYGCIAGYPEPDGTFTFRGERNLTRYEFAAALNACLQKIELLIANSEGSVSREDLETLYRLQQEFAAELAALGGRVDSLEGRVDTLEAQQFSTTTKLKGEAVFNLADTFGDTISSGGTSDNTQTVLTGRIRLNFVTSFTGRDQLITRLTAGNIGNSFQDELGTREGRFAFDGQSDNQVTVDRLHYRFPITDDLTAVVMPVLGAHHFYADVFNDGLNAGGGATGALSRFGERSPIYRLGIGVPTVGVGFRYKPASKLEFSTGYLAPQGSDPADGNGIFNGSYSALAQLVFKPTEDVRLGFTYVRGFDTRDFRGATLWGGTGTNLANLRGSDLFLDTGVTTNSYGFQALWDITPTVSVRGWFSYTGTDLQETEGDGDILNWAAILALKDLGKEGSTTALIFGAEPYLTNLEDGNGDDVDIPDDIPFHLEVSYKYPVNKFISITPGAIVLFSPNQDSDNDTIFIGAIRTTFTF